MLVKVERVALWAILIFMAMVGNYLWEHTARLKQAVAANVELLHAPELRAAVYPGVPTALRQHWKDAAPNAEGGPEAGRWLTVRVANAGAGTAAKLTVRLDVAQPIAGLRASTAGGGMIDGSRAGAKVEDGGEGKLSVTVTFPELAPQQASLLFVALAPETSAGNGDAAAWAANAPQHWRELVVSSAPDEYSKDVVTVRRYGLAEPPGG